MFKSIKEFFFGKPAEVAAPYKVEAPTCPVMSAPVEEVQPVVEAKVDAVAVALDLEPLDLAPAAAPAKKPRQPRAPKEAAAKPAKAVKPAKEVAKPVKEKKKVATMKVVTAKKATKKAK